MKHIITFLFLMIINCVIAQEIIANPQNSSGEGGELVLMGSNSSFNSWHIDNYIDNLRFFNNGIVHFNLAPTGNLTVNGNISLLNKVGFATYDSFDVSGSSVANYGMSLINESGFNNVGLSGFFGLNFYTSGAERLSISGNGNVGIGTTDTKGFKLGVQGKIAAEEVKVAVYNNWADFVFTKYYDLPTLKEVERHIKENGHLKDIPSAEDVKENGIFLGEMDSKLLQKIEELTLYAIKQQKEIENQKDKIEKLEQENEELQSLSDRLEDIEKLLNYKK